jgi:hypothetical protein
MMSFKVLHLEKQLKEEKAGRLQQNHKIRLNYDSGYLMGTSQEDKSQVTE